MTSAALDRTSRLTLAAITGSITARLRTSSLAGSAGTQTLAEKRQDIVLEPVGNRAGMGAAREASVEGLPPPAGRAGMQHELMMHRLPKTSECFMPIRLGPAAGAIACFERMLSPEQQESPAGYGAPAGAHTGIRSILPEGSSAP